MLTSKADYLNSEAFSSCSNVTNSFYILSLFSIQKSNSFIFLINDKINIKSTIPMGFPASSSSQP